MSSWARPGVKCVCILPDRGQWANPDGAPPDASAPRHKNIYTVLETETRYAQLYLVLAECSPDAMYHVRNFRPIVDQATDLALFAQHLQGVGESV